jgi:gliding motility-associated-like protein
VQVTDAAGCIITTTGIPVTQPDVLAIPPPAVQAPLCSGDDNGMITVNPAGGNPPYTYSLNGSAFQPANTFKVSAGSYSVRVLDSKNCGAIYSNITVAAPAPLSASVSGTVNATCEGGANGSITVTAAGGSGNYQYSSGGAFQSSNVLNVLAGTYTVTVKDVNGCLFAIPNVTVGLTNNLSFTPIADPAPICEGTSTTLQLTTNAASFSWTPNQPGVVNDASVANAVVHPSVTTLFHVTMQLGVCTAQDEVNVRVMPAPVPNAGPDGEICFGQNYQLQASGGIRYEWTPQRYLSDPFNGSPQVLQPERTITYSVTATDANNCSSLAPDEITITVIPPIQIKVSPADTVVYAGDRFRLIASSIASNYTWTPATGLSNAFIADPVVTAPSVDGAVVQYEVTASTAAGCKGEGQAIVRVYKGPEIYVANAFSPNNDGKNDVFIPFPVGIKQLKYFRVFNRWGQMIFSTTTLQQGWDGRFGGQDQPGGVYTWMVEGITHDDRKITKKGTVTLIR